jgi:hypothetical protein
MISIWAVATLTGLLILIGVLDLVPTQGAKWAMTAIIVIWASVYFMTVGAMAFVILGETSASSMRAQTVAWATAVQAIMGLIVNSAIPYVVTPDEANLKDKVGSVFGGLGAIAIAWAFMYVPELKGRMFEEIDWMFFARVPLRKMGSHVLTDG